ncbi:MAG: PAS domain S-box protein [Ferruginibacter sp.]|nr:PAS domain S-box protein [Ferruginibacter sp.]
MKNNQYYGVINYTAAGLILGVIMIVIGALLNYQHGFEGPWFHIFDYAPNFVIIVLSPVYLGLLFCFIGLKREQLVLFNRHLKNILLEEQKINSVADLQIKLLAKVMAQVNEAIVITDQQGKVQWVNDGFTKINGYNLIEVKGKELDGFLHGPLTNHEVVKSMIEKLSRGEAVVEELQTYHKNGNIIWLSLSMKPIYNDTGEIVNFISIQNNITSRKEKEIAIAALYKEVADYKFALDQSAIVIKFNIDGKIIHVNRKFCEINEMPEEELLGSDYRTVSISMRDRRVVKPIWEKIIAGNTWKGELVNLNNNGKTYWADTTIVPLLDGEGKPFQFLAIQQDISERKELENQLGSNKNKLQEAMQIARLGSWELDALGTLTLSAELRELYNLPLKDYISTERVFDNIHPDDLEHVKERMTLGRTTLQKVELEYRYIIGGQVHYMFSNNSPRLSQAGEYIGSFGTVQDITAAKLSALALKKSEEEKAVVLNNTQTIICLHDMNGVLLDINTAAEKMSGFSKKEVLGLNLKMIVSPEYQAEFDEYLHTINHNETASGTLQIFTKSGAKRVWLYQNTVYANNGIKPYVIASAIDITASVKAQNEIERQQQFIRQIINNSPNIIFMLNEQRQIVLANQTFSKYYPYNEKEMPLAESLSTGAEDIFLGDIDSLFEMEDGETIRLEGSLKNPATDTPSWFNIINKCFKEKNGKKYILGFGMDITGRYQVETDLIAANELVERALKVKDQFISNMSHEIRTPLNAVIGFTDLLADTPLNQEQAEYLDIVKTASGNLLALINNILDLSKIESSNLALESLPIDIRKIIQDVVKILEPKAKAKGIQMHVHLDDQLPLKVLGDQLRLTQVMFNLLGNAVKFTDEGSIDINCKVVKGSDKLKDYIAFSIKDTGIGVPENKQQDIFERFTQANTDTQRLYGGTGLGLNITKSIVDLHGGVLTLESEPGKGTTFHFILPFKKHIKTQNLNSVKSLSGHSILSINTSKPIHILLAEDNTVNAMLATQVLTKKGFTLVHVANGELAVEAVQQQHFDLVLMDIQMPVMNGINASMAIRQLNGEVSAIPIIAMTAHSLHGEMQNCYNAGMNGYVAKPFKPDDLFNSIIEAVKKEDNTKPKFNAGNEFELTA